MAITKATRTKMEKYIYDFFLLLDPSGANTRKYKQIFSKMSDTQFDTFFKNYFKDENSYLILDIIEYERELTFDNIEKTAKWMGVPLFEKVAIPFLSPDPENPVVTKDEVPVGYIHLKRTQQMLLKKNTTSIEASSRSALTGQVVGVDKNARESDSENFAMITTGADAILKELMSARADDMVMKTEMYSQIAKKGYVSLKELPDELENKTTLNTVDVFFMGMGIKTDLITDSLVIKPR